MANEKRLIDANALKDDFRRYMADRFDRERCVSEENCITCGRVCLFQRTINNAPTVNAVEVVHGRWEYDLDHLDGLPYKDEWYAYVFKCSICGGTAMGGNDKYCPNCGAKMDGGNNK